MKKIKIIAALFLMLMSMLAFNGCTVTTVDDTITLSFDQTAAYFQSETELYPIEGDTPGANEKTEVKTVKLTSNKAVRMRVVIKTSASIDGLKVMVGNKVQEMADGVVLYESASAETSASFDITVFLASSADDSNAKSVIDFELVLERAE